MPKARVIVREWSCESQRDQNTRFGFASLGVETRLRITSGAWSEWRQVSGVATRRVASSARDQKSYDFRQDLFCFDGQFFRTGAGQGVRDHGKGIARRAVRLGDGLAVGDEEVRTDRSGWNAALLEKDPVQHTAG